MNATYYIRKYNLRSGDEIIVPKSQFNLVQHHALYVGDDENGVAWIIENVIYIGVRLITADDFFRINPNVNEVRPFYGSTRDRNLLVERALRNLGEPYDLINYNCQHFASEVITGKPESKQIQKSLAGLALLFLAGIVISK